jgi:FkbM family methyltransferase
MNCKSFETPCGLTIAHLNRVETEFVYKEIFQERAYLKHGITLQDGDCVFDIGANIGLFTIFVQEHFSNVKVFAFEPSFETFNILVKNTGRYGSNVVACPFGVAGGSGEALFTFYPGYSILSGFHGDVARDTETIRCGILNMWRERFPGAEDPEQRFVDAMTQEALGAKEERRCQLRAISQVIDEANIPVVSLLKIDAEGSELEILDGIRDDQWRKIRQIALEIHDKDGDKLPRIKEILQSHRFHAEFEEAKNLRSSGIINCFAKS